MATDRAARVEALLTEAEKAHGVYETTELNGVYDEDWPQWYAGYAVDHGIGDLVGRPVTKDQLTAFLGTTNVDFKEAAPPATESWASYTAGRITEEL